MAASGVVWVYVIISMSSVPIYALANIQVSFSKVMPVAKYIHLTRSPLIYAYQ